MARSISSRPFVFSTDPSSCPAGLEGAVYALGNFDGLHRGHKAVLDRAKAIAAASNRAAAVLTFEPHPADHFAGANTIFRLTPLTVKAALVERYGMNGMVVFTFDEALANRTAESFVADLLSATLRGGAVVAGYDFHFGKMRGGTPAFLVDAGQRHGFGVDIVERVDHDDVGDVEPASSTATRLALEQGDVARATRLLGHHFMISGVVQGGRQLGRTLGFPTANLPADASCRLRYGIYAVRAEVAGQLRAGIASWGRRPAVDNGAPLLEVFLFDFDGDLYGQRMDVSFVAWIRPEQFFPDLASMTAQMRRDVLSARTCLADPA